MAHRLAFAVWSIGKLNRLHLTSAELERLKPWSSEQHPEDEIRQRVPGAAQLSALVDALESGENIEITRRGVPVFRLTRAAWDGIRSRCLLLVAATNQPMHQVRFSADPAEGISLLSRLELDSSLVVAAVVQEAGNAIALAFLQEHERQTWLVSPWVATELASALAFQVRRRAITLKEP